MTCLVVVYAVVIILAFIRNEWVYQTRARIMRDSMDAFRAGKYELVFLAPEALDGYLGEFVRGCPISLLVVDEARGPRRGRSR